MFNTPASKKIHRNLAPILIAHRGASADRPEHTLASYQLAIDQGADFIEPDLVLTKDGVLVARHENEISETTDVADHPEFADRKATKIIDGQIMSGWFTEEFTLAELKTLRAKERLPLLRPANMAYNGQFEIPTFAEILALTKVQSHKTGRRIGVYPETKHPSYFAQIGLPHTPPLLALLDEFGLTDADDPVFIQSFEVSNLQALRRETDVRLIQLIDAEGGPADRPDTRYIDMLTPKGLAEIATYANGIGPNKSLVIPRDTTGQLMAPTPLIEDAHAAGLAVHPWTFRPENFFLPAGQQYGGGMQGRGDLIAEIKAYILAGVDGLFSDDALNARAAIDAGADS
jgi:glycerophosphoryl diester phosphodiesterase